MRRGRSRFPEAGYSLPEILVAVAIFAVLSLTMLAAFVLTSKIYRHSSGRDSATRELQKAARSLRRDLALARVEPGRFQVGQVGPSLGGGSDGDAVVFVSPVDPTIQELRQKSDGSPFMMRNILYYLVAPGSHAQTFGYPCPGIADADGYEGGCPHKVLLRASCDGPLGKAPADPADPASENTLVPLVGLLLPMNGLQPPPDYEIVAVNLQTFRCRPQDGRFEVDLAACDIGEARREGKLGSSLTGSPYQLQVRFSVYAGN